MRSIGLKTQQDGKALCKMKFAGKRILPESIPLSPERTYRGKGWICYGDWLGNGRILPFLKQTRSFERARAFVRSLGLKNQEEWLSFCKGEMEKKGLLPEDIPVAPHHVYRGKGWVNWGDFLGRTPLLHTMDFKSLEEADLITNGVDINNKLEWNLFCWANFRKTRSLPEP